MSLCKCGCNLESATGDFAPGHDQKLRIRLEKEVGGLLALERLVKTAKSYAIGDISGQEFECQVRQLFTKT
jgi:hypothetical protein